jgi:hypothetical protein
LPTYERSPQFIRDYEALNKEERAAFRRAVDKFIQDLKAGTGFRKGLRVKRIQAWEGMFELTWADDGRAVFSYGSSRREGEPHVIWHALGTHDILP